MNSGWVSPTGHDRRSSWARSRSYLPPLFRSRLRPGGHYRSGYGRINSARWAVVTFSPTCWSCKWRTVIDQEQLGYQCTSFRPNLAMVGRGISVAVCLQTQDRNNTPSSPRRHRSVVCVTQDRNAWTSWCNVVTAERRRQQLNQESQLEFSAS